MTQRWTARPKTSRAASRSTPAADDRRFAASDEEPRSANGRPFNRARFRRCVGPAFFAVLIVTAIPRSAMAAGPEIGTPPAEATGPAANDQVPGSPKTTRGAVLHDKLFTALKNARSEAEGRAIENEIWRFWLAEAPDPETRALVDDAMTKRGVYDTEGAEAVLDQAVAKSPDYAEVYNQRAFVRFLRDDLDGALEDADRAIALEPDHFGAMAGRALILLRQGRAALAQAQLKQAVAIHPFLKERSMLVPPPSPPPGPPATAGSAPERPAGIDL